MQHINLYLSKTLYLLRSLKWSNTSQIEEEEIAVPFNYDQDGNGLNIQYEICPNLQIPVIVKDNVIETWVKVVYEEEVFLRKIQAIGNDQDQVRRSEKSLDITKSQKFERDEDAAFQNTLYMADVEPQNKKYK